MFLAKAPRRKVKHRFSLRLGDFARTKFSICFKKNFTGKSLQFFKQSLNFLHKKSPKANKQR